MTLTVDDRLAAQEGKLGALEADRSAVSARISSVGVKVAAAEARAAAIESALAAQESRVSALEAEGSAVSARLSPLDVRMALVEGRATAIESGLAALQQVVPSRPGGWEKFGQILSSFFDAIGKVAIPIVVVILTWGIKDSVDSALKQRELEVTEGKSMQDALTTLRAKAGITQEAAEAAALVLASMGTPSIPILINEHNFGTPEEALAVDNALLVLGLTHRDELCRDLRAVISDNNGRFRIGTQKLAAKHIGIAKCPDSVISLHQVMDLLGDNKRYAGRFRIDPTPDDVNELRGEVDRALKRIES